MGGPMPKVQTLLVRPAEKSRRGGAFVMADPIPIGLGVSTRGAAGSAKSGNPESQLCETSQEGLLVPQQQPID